MDQLRATAVLQRFNNVINTVAKNVTQTFPSVTEVEDTAQEAAILVLSYAGLVPGGRHAGRLDQIEQATQGDEARIQRLMTTQLRMDLVQMYGREAEKREPTYSLESLPENTMPPVFDLTDSLKNEREFEKHYPTLTLWLINDQTQEQIAEMANVSLTTVERRIAKEKRLYLERYARRGGLRVEGNESLAELQEACSHLKAAGR